MTLEDVKESALMAFDTVRANKLRSALTILGVSVGVVTVIFMVSIIQGLNKAFADQIGVTFPLLSDWGGEATHKYGVYVDEYRAARRINFLIGKDGKILEEQVDKDAIDPKKIVDACERPKLKS